MEKKEAKQNSVNILNCERVLPLMISGYRFENMWTNFLLSSCCEIPVNQIILGKFMMEKLTPKNVIKNEEKTIEVDVVDNTNSKNEGMTPANLVSDETKESVPLLFESAIYSGRTNIVYAPGKLGKSQLTMEAAKNPLIKRPAFILREDYSGEQLDNYRRIVGEKAILVTLPDWKKIGKELEDKQELKANAEILMRFTNASFHKFRNISDLVYGRAGLSKNGKNFDEFMVFQAVVKILLEDGADFICLDSLNALTGGNAKISRAMIERLLDVVVGKNITFLLVHHTNKKGEIFGSIDVVNAFDHIYQLSKIRVPKEQVIYGTDRLLLDETSRYTRSKKTIFERKWVDNTPVYKVLSDTVPEFEIQDFATATIAERIKNILTYNNSEIILLDDLIFKLGNVSKRTLKNNLGELKENGLIKMTDGKTWYSITILF
jgi:hypothetical protein